MKYGTATQLSLVMLFVCVIGPNAMGDANEHPYEGFTAAWKKIEIAAAEPGQVTAIHTRKGAFVVEGQLLVVLDTAVLESRKKILTFEANATAKLEGLKVQQNIQQRRLLSVQQLQQSGASTVDELLTAEADYQVAVFNSKIVEEELQRRTLELDEIGAMLERKQVRSPIRGYVTEVTPEIGEFVSQTNPHVVTVVDLTRLRATFFLPTEDALTIRVGQKLSVRMVELRLSAPGTVEYVGIETLADSGRVQVDVQIDNPDLRYRSGLRCTLNRSSMPIRTEGENVHTARKPGDSILK